MTTPKLRFPEFNENWNKQRLDNFLERVSNPVDVIANKQYTQIGIRSHGKGIFHKEAITGEELGNKRVFWIEPNAFIVNIVFAWERAIAVTSDTEKGMIASHRFPMYLPKNNLSNVNFLRYFFLTDKGQTYLELASPGGAGRNKTLGQSNFAELKINLPILEEQIKIANFLSAVDEKIDQLTQKLHLLNQYKQGMMQKLFSKQIRFKADDGSEFGEWEEKKLGEICQFINGRAYKQTEWEKEGIPVIRLQNLTGSGKEYYYSNLNLPAHQYCYNNDLLYMWSATFGPVFWQGEKAIFHYHIWKIEVNPSLLDRKYMYFLLDEMTEKMKRSLNGSTMLHVTKQGMENTQKIVPSLPEQTKIANFLSAIDQKINVVSEQLEQAKLWKKGLLQQMFV
nr:restriction endonuclease subunit S [Acinetobacter variabilis]